MNRKVLSLSADPLVSNGMEFVESAVRLLGGERPTAQQSREALVLLAIGVELLLKSRLLAEHWALVFENVGKAKLSELRDGSLKSAGPEDCLNRLADICEVRVSDRTRKTFEHLWTLRNRVVHFAVKLSAETLRARAFDVLSELIDLFDRSDFLPAEAEDHHQRLRKALLVMRPFIDARHAAIAQQIASAGTASFYCPACEQRTIAFRNGSRRCLFCLSDSEVFQEITSIHLEREHEIGESAAYRDALASCVACEGFFDVVQERRGLHSFRCLQCWRRAELSELRRCPQCGHQHLVASEPTTSCVDCGASFG